jgi:hypothetical protein
MSKHVYLRAYMAGITVPSAVMVLALTMFCVVRLGFQYPLPIERALVFPMALVPNLWGLWNMLYVVVRRRRQVPIGLFGALVPLIITPIGLAVLRALALDIPRFVLAAFPVGLAVIVGGYYLIWKYAVGFFNRLLEIA